MSEDAIGQPHITPPAPTVRQQLIDAIEFWLNGGTRKTPTWNVGVDVNLSIGMVVAVGMRFLGKSTHRKRWTRCAFGANVRPEVCQAVGLEGVAAIFARKLRANYTEYANMTHWGLNRFRPKRAKRGMRGK